MTPSSHVLCKLPTTTRDWPVCIAHVNEREGAKWRVCVPVHSARRMDSHGGKLRMWQRGIHRGMRILTEFGCMHARHMRPSVQLNK